jgi:hypothetical protein
MVKVFSFCIFGSKDKYVKGLLKNIELITSEFPDSEIWVYVGNDVPYLGYYDNVKYIHTGIRGNENKFFRYFPIDDEQVEVAFIRDADSRVYSRDVKFIKEFLLSDKLFHSIQDNINHPNCGKIMAGMWGIKKGLLKYKVYDMYLGWKHYNSVNDFWDDTRFLDNVIYPLVVNDMLLHNDIHNNEKDFVGQVYDFSDGKEYTIF